MLEETIGAVRCGVRLSPEAAFAEFDLPRLPEEKAADVRPRSNR